MAVCSQCLLFSSPANVLCCAKLRHQCISRLQPLPGPRVPEPRPSRDLADSTHAGHREPRGACACRCGCCCPEADADRQTGGRSTRCPFWEMPAPLDGGAWGTCVLLPAAAVREGEPGVTQRAVASCAGACVRGPEGCSSWVPLCMAPKQEHQRQFSTAALWCLWVLVLVGGL